VERERARHERELLARGHRVAIDQRGASEIVEHAADGVGARGSGLVVSPVVPTVAVQSVLGAEKAIAASRAVVSSNEVASSNGAASNDRLAKAVPREHRGHSRSRVQENSDEANHRAVVSREDRPAPSSHAGMAHGTSDPPSRAVRPSVLVRRRVVGQRRQPVGVPPSRVNGGVGVVGAGADEAVSARYLERRAGLRFPTR
jgi:hypothetical protein